ncbi:hypothetical protein AB0N62_38520 [Streptomyces sp. NPDC093982]|uniref:hypothetical protein n=1 Tax=Streptomyces sp. NPDC093982 TaxID=3155077 RepID=UPI0034139B47
MSLPATCSGTSGGYYLQHGFGYQCHDRAKPHHYRQHGRAPICWEAEDGPDPA